MRIIKKITAAVISTASAVTMVSAVMPGASAAKLPSELVQDSGLDYDYARALQYSIYFYDANMCGTGVADNNLLNWRGNCHTYDAKVPLKPMGDDEVGTNLSESFIKANKSVLDPDGDGFVDVSGGFHDAGDHVKFGMPENYTASTLGWGYYEFRKSYEKLGQDNHIETILRYINDYLMKCTFLDKDGKVVAHCYQVGDGDIDHAYWQSPEVDEMARPAYFLTADKPQTDYVVSAAASLAINYLNFKDTDTKYAKKSLDYAKALWKFANDNPKELSDNGDGPGQYYFSNKWEDDYAWAASWLYTCTGDAQYLKDAAPYFDYYAADGWCYCWNDMWSGAILRWAIIDQQHPELNIIQMLRDALGKGKYDFTEGLWAMLEKCFPTWKAKETPQEFAFLQVWGSARYNTAMQLIALVHDKYKNDGKPSEFSKWAEKQMKYIMGDNDITFLERIKQNEDAEKAGDPLPWSEDELHGSRCLICGYNDNSVQYPHHRAASGLLSAEDTRPQKHVLWGALAGGVDGKDQHDDYTNNYTLNEVTIDYNAAFVGACAGLYQYFGTPDMAVTENFPPDSDMEDDPSTGEGGGSGYWVEAIGVDDLNKDDGSGVTKCSFKVMTNSSDPADKVSIRYFFNIKELKKGISGVTELKELYDQSSAEAKIDNPNADGIISGPFQYKASYDPNVYYIQIDWDGYKVANSGKKYQFDVGNYYGDLWDPTNDWSYQTMKIGTDQDFFAISDGVEVRNDHICVYTYQDGKEMLVGGIEPDGTEPVSSAGLGDVNKDLKINVADVTALHKYLAKRSKKLADPDMADMDGNGKLNVLDFIILKRTVIGKK